MQIIDKKKLVIAALALNKNIFVIYVAHLGSKMLIDPACEAQIVLLLAKKVSISKKYANFLNVFSK